MSKSMRVMVRSNTFATGDAPRKRQFLRRWAWLLGLAGLCTSFSPASAEVPLDGALKAVSACPATPSIRRDDNPGGVMLEAGRSYDLVGENSEGGTHYLVVVPGASPPRRWVAVACGEREAKSGGAARPSVPKPSQGASSARRLSERNVLALSWQPAFCEGQPGRPECRTQRQDRADASRLSLHGLWPQPRTLDHCDVAPEIVATDKDGRWTALPDPGLSPAVRAALETAMPGVASGLDRHEWIRHGTCYGGSADEYFGAALALLDAVNASPVGALLAGNVGRSLTAEEIRAAFDKGFGEGAGQRVRLSCRNDGDRQILVELTIGLTGRIGVEPDLASLIAAARPTDPGCPAGVVDPVGRQ